MDKIGEYVDRLYACSNRIDGWYYIVSRKLGMSGSKFILLYDLADGKPHSQKQICETLLIPKTTLNTVVRGCVAEGYITLSGGREKLMELTPAGREYIDMGLVDVIAAENSAMESTIEEFGAGFVDAMERFESALGGELKRRVLGGEA